MPVPRPAATVALLRPGPAGPEVLLTHRPASMAFGPGLHVFPGGGVDAGDTDPGLQARCVLPPDGCAEAWAGDLDPAAAGAAAVAAIRELYEEAGILLADARLGRAPSAGVVDAARRAGAPFARVVEELDLRLRTDLLVPLSRWVTPPVGVSRRYDARFFVALLPPGAEVAPDDREVVAHDWMTPAAALVAMAEGRIELWPPTATTLQQLARVRDLDDVRRSLSPVAPAVAPSADMVRPGLARVRLHGAGGIPGAAANAYLVGRRRLVVVDPGDPNDAGVEAILAAARPGRITAVLLTAPTPERAAGSTSIALQAGVPVMAAPGAARELAGGAQPLEDGRWLDLADTRVHVVATPGTHPHHLAFDLPELDAVLVGDLEGDRPAHGIAEPVDEGALAASRARVGARGRAVSLPLRGDPLA